MGFGKDGKGVIIREARSQPLLTLAQNTGLIIGSNIAILERFRMLKAEIVATIIGVTGNELAGLGLYLVDGAFTLAEFEASLELIAGPVGPNESTDEEIAERFSQMVGIVLATETATETVFRNAAGGGMLEVKPRWTFARTKSWNWIIYNHAEVPTTGATVLIKCKSFGVWVT